MRAWSVCDILLWEIRQICLLTEWLSQTLHEAKKKLPFPKKAAPCRLDYEIVGAKLLTELARG